MIKDGARVERLGFVPPSAEINPPLCISIVDKYMQQTGLKIEITFSHFQTELIYFYIRYDTPAGAIIIDPDKHFSYCMNLDLDNMASTIRDGLKNSLQKIMAGCMEPLFDIEILRQSNDITTSEIGHLNVEYVEFLFTLTIDMAKIFSGTTTNSNISITMIVDRACLEEFVSFLVEISNRYAKYRESNKEIFDSFDKIVKI
jgi:hypothetical protein